MTGILLLIYQNESMPKLPVIVLTNPSVGNYFKTELETHYHSSEVNVLTGVTISAV